MWPRRYRGTSSNRCSWLIIYCSTDSTIPQFLSCLPVGAWSSLFHILGLVSTYLGHSSPSVRETERHRPAHQQHTAPYTHLWLSFSGANTPLSCCYSSTGKVLYKVQQSTAVMFKCDLKRTVVAWWWAWRLFMESDLWTLMLVRHFKAN